MSDKECEALESAELAEMEIDKLRETQITQAALVDELVQALEVLHANNRRDWTPALIERIKSIISKAKEVKGE